MSKLIEFDSQFLDTSMQAIKKAVIDKNLAKFQAESLALLTLSGSVGASRIHFACYAAQLPYTRNQLEEMQDHFILLLESVIEFKRCSRKLIATYKSKFFLYHWPNRLTILDKTLCESISYAETDLPLGYKLAYAKETGQFFCVKEGQTGKFPNPSFVAIIFASN